MANHSNTKAYNKAIMNSGKKSIKYIDESLANLNKYSNDYSGRLDYWTEKLNNRQLDLLSDEFLAQNARMLRGQGQFGSTSGTSRQQEQTAYDQSSYLANVANANVAAANQLQNNELSALLNNVQVNYQNRQEGLASAQTLDSMNNQWLNLAGGAASAIGGIMTMFPYTKAAGHGIQAAGNALSSYANAGNASAQAYFNKQATSQGAQTGLSLMNFSSMFGGGGSATGVGQSIFSTGAGSGGGYVGTLPSIGGGA